MTLPNYLILAIACELALAPKPSAAQAPMTVAVDATFGAGVGKGGEFFDRTLPGARIAASIRRSGSTRVGFFGEVAMDWISIASGHAAVCYRSPRGGCLDSYPEFAGPTAVVGLIAQPIHLLELRLGVGGAAYTADGTRVAAALSQFDAALFPVTHVGLVAGARWIVVPRYRGDRLSVLPWMAGLRFR